MRVLQHDVCACVYARARAGADLDYRAPSADFPPSSPRFHGRPSPRRENYPDTPSIPLFRSRRFNPGFSTQFGALHGGLYAPARLTRHIRYTHPLSPSLTLSLSLPPSRAYYLPTLWCTRTRVCMYVYTTPAHIPDRLVSCFHPVRPRSLARATATCHLPSFSLPPPFVSPSSSLFYRTNLLSPSPLARSHSLSLCFSLHPSSSSLSLCLFLYPLRHRLYPREQPPPP